jgi:hypothetical protein
LTGDMQLTKAEIMATQMLITTPEKWDVITRKSTGLLKLDFGPIFLWSIIDSCSDSR